MSSPRLSWKLSRLMSPGAAHLPLHRSGRPGETGVRRVVLTDSRAWSPGSPLGAPSGRGPGGK